MGCADRSAYDLTAHSKKTGEKLVARDRLDTPLVTTKLTVEVVKKVFGPALKKRAGVVEKYLAELDEDDLKKIKTDLDAGEAFVDVEGETHKLTPSMLTIEPRTVTLNGKLSP